MTVFDPLKLRDQLSPGQLAQMACILEVSARKPGNVHPGRSFRDTHFIDFLLSASVIAPAMDQARSNGLGRTILEAVRATRKVVATNTNLGMILLFAPLAAVPPGQDLRGGVVQILGSTTVNDARQVYQAIREAQPGGLGEASEQDIAKEPTVNLLEAMRLAANRDLVAAQYANGYAEVFDLALPALRAGMNDLPLESAIVFCYLHVLANRQDTLIARKQGKVEAAEASRRAAKVLESGWPNASEGCTALAGFDDWLRAEGHARNPGTTADLVAACLFVALGDGTIPLPRPMDPFRGPPDHFPSDRD